MTEPLIELGEDRTPPAEPSRGDRGRIRSARAAILFGLTAAALSLLGPCAAPVEPAISLVAIVPRPNSLPHGQDIKLVGELLITYWHDTVTAYGLDGKVRWRFSGNALMPPRVIESAASRRLILVRQGTSAPTGHGGTPFAVSSATVALDPVTGAQVWRVDSGLLPVGDFLVGSNIAGRMEVYRGSPPELVWQTAPLRVGNVDSQRKTVIGLTDEGLLTEWDLATGEALRGREVEPPAGDGRLSLWTVGDRLFLRSLGGDNDDDIIGFDRSTFSRIEWADSWIAREQCGRSICALGSDDRSRVALIDPAAGAVWWESSGRAFTATPAGVLATALSYGPSVPVIGLLHPGSGGEREALSGWFVAGPRYEGVQFLVKPGTGRSEVAVLEPGGLRPVGTVPYRVDECRYWAETMVCDLNSGDLGVWRLSP